MSTRTGAGSFAASRLRRAFATALGLACLCAAAGVGPAFAQGPGCNPCDTTITIGPFSFPNPFAAPAPAPYSAPADRPRRSGDRLASPSPSEPSQSRTRARHGGGSSGKAAEETGQLVHVCVRKCDGSFFPLPYSGAAGATLEDVCRALCPYADVALYSMPFGGTINEGRSSTGSPYSVEPNALKFQQAFEPGCSCLRPGESWADALAAAEARFGHRSHDILVTAEASAAMARPKPDPRPASLAESRGVDPPAVDPSLDANGVDTRLKSATEGVSREASGIKGEDAGASRIGLTAGHVIEGVDPDGQRRRVRVLTPM